MFKNFKSKDENAWNAKLGELKYFIIVKQTK